MLLSACGMTYPTDAQIEHEGPLVRLLDAIAFAAYDTTLCFALHVDGRYWPSDYWSYLLLVQILRTLVPFLLI